jgi:very-short-patch-repair endonuclease
MTSEPERALATQILWSMLPNPEVEHRFAPPRRWRFDMAWPDRMLALEIDGGSWSGGRHTTGKGFEADCEKYSEAAVLGWRVLRVTPRMVEDGRAVLLLARAFVHLDPNRP